MGVSVNGGTPKSSILIGVFHYNRPLGYPYFLETSIFTYMKNPQKYTSPMDPIGKQFKRQCLVGG